MKHLGAVCKGGIHFGSCYLHCNWDHNRTFNLDLLQCISAMVATLRGPWIIGGDWQCTPDELRRTGWLKMVKGVIYAPEAPTFGSRVLDYFIVSEGLAQSWAIVATCVIGDALFGPHSPVRLIVKANTRTALVRQLKVPIGFKADLPFGPLPQTGCPRALCDTSAVVPQAPPSTPPGGWSQEPGKVSGDNFANNDARSMAELECDYNGRVESIEAELCVVEGA